MKKILAALILALAAASARAQNFDGSALAMTDDYLALRAERAARAPEPPAAVRAAASANADLGALALGSTSERAEALCAQIPGGCTGLGADDTLSRPSPEGVNRILDHYVQYGATLIVIDQELCRGAVAAHVRELKSRGVKIMIASPN